MGSPPQTIREWQQSISEYADAAGWWDDPKGEGRSPAMLFALVHSEVSEALEEYRKGRGVAERYYSVPGSGQILELNSPIPPKHWPLKPEGIPSELADVMIRVLDMAAHWGIDLQEVMEEKDRFNRTRGYKHGGKKF